MVREGDAFPTLPNLGDLSGALGHRPVVVYFYPAAGTPGCTRETEGFGAAADAFDALGVAVVGVSTDRPATNARFAERLHIGFPLVSDVGGEAVRALGIAAPSGKARRVTYLLDGSGRVVRVWDPVKVDGHVGEVLEEARRLVGR